MTPSNNHHPAIVFDFGGVLVDWNPHYLYRKFFTDDASIDQFLNEIGFKEWNQHQDGGRPFDDAVAELSARFPHRADLIQAFHERWLETIGGPLPGSIAILRRLKEAGRQLLGITNWSEEKFKLVRYAPDYTFFDWFDAIVVSGEVKLMKPDPRIFALLLEQAGRRAQECVYVDDTLHNVTAAADLGFHAIHFTSPEQLEQDLLEMGVLP